MPPHLLMKNAVHPLLLAAGVFLVSALWGCAARAGGDYPPDREDPLTLCALCGDVKGSTLCCITGAERCEEHAGLHLVDTPGCRLGVSGIEVPYCMECDAVLDAGGCRHRLGRRRR